jgi:hypothetical protein
MQKQPNVESRKDPGMLDLRLSSMRNSKLIKATPEVLYHAFTDSDAPKVWFASGNISRKDDRFSTMFM